MESDQTTNTSRARHFLQDQNASENHDAARLENSFFFTGYSILLFYVVSYNSMLRDYIPFQGKWSIAACAMFFISELLVLRREGLRKYFCGKTAFGLIAILFSFAVTVHCGSTTPLVVFICIYCARRISFDAIARVAASVITLSCVLIMILAALGLIDDVIWIQGERIRHGLGMRYTTTMSHYLFFCTLLYLYIKKWLLGLWDTITILSADTAIYLLTNSRNSFGLTIAAVALAWFARAADLKTICQKMKLIMGAAIPVFAAVSICLMITFEPSIGWQNELNHVLGGRLEISNRSYLLYGIPLLGQDQDFVGQGIEEGAQKREGAITFIDNSYCNLLITKGPLFTLLLLGLLTTLMWRTALEGKYTVTFTTLLTALHALTDPQLLTLQFNVPLLLIGTELLRDESFDEGLALSKRYTNGGNEHKLMKAAIALIGIASVFMAAYIHHGDSYKPSLGVKMTYSTATTSQSVSQEPLVFETTTTTIDFKDIEGVFSEDFNHSTGDVVRSVWTADLTPLTSGIYELAVRGKGSIKVYLDDRLAINAHDVNGTEYVSSKTTFDMRAGSYHPIKVEWEGTLEEDSVHVYWRTVGNEDWHVIPYNCYSLQEQS